MRMKLTISVSVNPDCYPFWKLEAEAVLIWNQIIIYLSLNAGSDSFYV